MTAERSDDEERVAGIDRRKFIAVGGGVGAALLAGCTSDDPSGSDSPDGSGGTDTPTGDAASFRLLVSDAPADIGDFDSLDVTLERARVFEGGDGGEEKGSEETETEESEGTDGAETDAENGTETEQSGKMTPTVEEDKQQTGDDETAAANETATDSADGGEGGEEDGVDDGESDDGDRGFYVLDLDDPTVDLTQVVGDKAVAVFDGELSEGSYRKLELHVADVEGIVDGEAVEVKAPSEKLQLTKSFEVRAGEELDFVFDINVVKRGNQASYNLKPVISQSGVRGKDVEVEVEEVGDESGEGESESEDGSDGGTEAATDSEGGDASDDNGTDGEEDSDDGGADAGDGADDMAGNESSV